MTSISTWYHNQYSTWNRTRRIQASPFLARTDTRTSRTATAMAQSGAVLVNMASEDSANRKESKQLFGPDIGLVNNVPAWAHTVGKCPAADSLSADIIKSWIAKSKEPSQPTTTLQALVNLKRPTLRLVPLTIAPGDDPDQADSHHHHGLEFEYDCDAPKCKIDVNVVVPADHPLAENVDTRGFSRILVFQSVVDGGFGKFLKLEHDATLELGRFEQFVRAEDVPSEKPLQTDAQVTGTIAAPPQNGRPKKRFAPFHFRKRSGDRAASGPALAVVDADTANASPESEKDKGSKDDSREGVRVAIRLSALDEDGMDLPTVNEQTTFLHVVRVGTPAADEEDARPWVVKVVKREATIGPHTFHLHEIYGLTAQSTTPSNPRVSSRISTDAHTYPPPATPVAPATVHEDEPSSECLLCLSSPREVILLPCRHLVACRECAINMVEFGAGGNITHNEIGNATTNAVIESNAGEGASGAANANGGATEGTNPPTVAPPNPRRKRKAKGWFCPVCRQPYTSLLRISTTPPTKDISDDENRGSTSIDEPENEQEGGEGNGGTGLVPTNNDPLSAAPGGMMNTLRSGFRNLALGGATRQESDTLPRDVERGPGSEDVVA